MNKFEMFMEKHKMLEWDMYTTEDMENLYKLTVEACATWIANTDSDPEIGEEDAEALMRFFLED